MMVQLSAAVAGSSLVEATDPDPVWVTADGITILDGRVIRTSSGPRE